jgi:hypothetical protein
MPFLNPPPEWNAGSVAVVGANLALNAGTISATGGGASEWTAGSVTAIGANLTITSDTLAATVPAAEWNAGSVTTIGTGLTITSDTLSATGGGGGGTVTVNGQGGAIAQGATINLDTVPYSDPSLTTWINQGNASITQETNGPLVLQNQTITANAANARVKSLSLAAAFTLVAHFTLNSTINNNAPAVGVALSDGTKLVTFENASGKGAFNQYAVQSWTNSTTYSSNLAVLDLSPAPEYWLRIVFNGTATWTFSVSLDGFVWIQIYTTSSLPLTPSEIGVHVSGYNTTGTQAAVAALNYWNGI